MLIQTLPWIPVTLVAIALTLRFPLGGASWPRHVALHLVAAAALSFVANVFVVLGYWATTGQFHGVLQLVRSAATWATVRLHLALAIYGGILVITQLVTYYRRSRERELQLARVEGQLARAQVQALNAQIRPHFLFNTLHTIGQLWRSGRNDQADAVLDALGALFHKVQGATSRTAIPLAEEIEMVREYLAIEQARFGDRLRTTVRVSDEALGCTVPPLILQPIVENAVRHGISAVSSASVIDVSVERDNGRLTIVVFDDGPGPGAVQPTKRAGVGISNTRERLAQLYGAEASLTLGAGPRGGTVATLAIPVVQDRDDG
jgi:LytS/YehU family sensor histidine kinase